MEEKSNLYVVSIVAVVAIIGIMVMVLGVNKNSGYKAPAVQGDDVDVTGLAAGGGSSAYNLVVTDIIAISSGTDLGNTFESGKTVDIVPFVSNKGTVKVRIGASGLKYTLTMNGQVLLKDAPCGIVNADFLPNQIIKCNSYMVAGLSQAGNYNVAVDIDSNNVYTKENNLDNTRTELYSVTTPILCVDTDGFNFNVAGSVTVDGITNYDYCTSIPTANGTIMNLMEYYCAGAVAATYGYSCPNGCDAGKCI